MRVDAKGVLRDTKSHEELSFYGLNYTLPFAHAYRAMGYLGVEPKRAIDRDVYHFARIGMNAYRVHLWDVELSDTAGNLQQNHHLDLMDYLIHKLRERGIRTLITAQTNFGNGYPERNQPTGGFSYNYDKCEMHSHPEAVAAQERYVTQLMQHRNPYTGKTYEEDGFIVGFEINNEPCHEGDPTVTEAYITRMAEAVRSTGWSKPLLYNVSHNREHVEAYYRAPIDGTTYQWYPIGLVAGKELKGNFLPHVDHYAIPFANARGFDSKAKFVYEFDPADNLYGYLYPAMARTFRTAGFQWITQFAYDPIDMAAYNTEYQTHYLNLAYTPQKAISMKIAAEVARFVPRGESYGNYPDNLQFGPFTLRYAGDQGGITDEGSEFNTDERFFYTNGSTATPKSPKRLREVAGCGSSAVVQYEGTGAYFLDRLEEGVWRLEVMPDAVTVADPFAKPSLKREVVVTRNGAWPMVISLPNLGSDFSFVGLNSGNIQQGVAVAGRIDQLSPGAYLLQRKGVKPNSNWSAESLHGTIRIGEFVAPEAKLFIPRIVNSTPSLAERADNYRITASIVANPMPDSVLIYTDRVSFWSDHNQLYPMERTEGYRYEATLPASEITNELLRYQIVAYCNGVATTYPGAVEGAPLDWDFAQRDFYTLAMAESNAPIPLFNSVENQEGFTVNSLDSEVWPRWSWTKRTPHAPRQLRLGLTATTKTERCIARRYVRPAVTERPVGSAQASSLVLEVEGTPSPFEVGFVTTQGYTYKGVATPDGSGRVRIVLNSLTLHNTALLPHAYPTFMVKEFTPTHATPFSVTDIEQLEISFEVAPHSTRELVIGSIWME